METLTFAESLKSVSETASEYEKYQRSYAEKYHKKTDVEKEISIIKEDIKKLSAGVMSVPDIKKELLTNVEKSYSMDVAAAKTKFENRNKFIDDSENQDGEIKLKIQEEYNRKISDAYSKVNNTTEEVDNLSNQIIVAKDKYEELDKQINDSLLEENQVKLCKEHIASKYENVADNAGFISDYKDPRGVTPEDAKNKFVSLSPKKIKKIADKMNRGIYVSSPEESKGFPILEIFIMTITALGIILKGLFQGIGLLYKPINKFSKLIDKIMYAIVVSAVLFLILWVLGITLGDSMAMILIFLFAVIILAFLGMILFNFIKYSNKAFRKEQNLEYYTVGYFFTSAKDEILFKIAREYHANLKEKSPEELQNILKATFGEISNKKEIALSELNSCEETLISSKQKLSDVTEQYKKEEITLKAQCKEQIVQALEQLQSERTQKREQAQIEYQQEIAEIEKRTENAKINVENAAIQEVEKKKQEILQKEQSLTQLEENKRAVVREIEKIYDAVDDIVKRNNEMAKIYKKQDISAIDKRTVNDKISDSLTAGVFGYVNKNLKTGKEEKIYKQVQIQHNKKPVIIIHNMEDDESTAVTKTYYSFIDSLVGDLLGKTYLGAFRFVLVDSQGNRAGIVKNMETCQKSFEDLERYGCIKVCTEHSDKCFDNLLKEQEKLLDGKNIDEVNDSKKNLDNMVRYNFLCIRIYSKKTNDFSISEFRRRMDSSLNNGVIPIVLMSQNYFSEKQSTLEGTIKELCGAHYYRININKENNDIWELSLEEENI